MVDLKNIILTKPTEDLERILSPFIEEQFPSFVRRDYRKLVLFLKAYYEWSESKGNPGYVLSNLDTIYDIDRSLEEFYSHFKSTYLEGFPDVLATNISGRKPNKNTLLKHIRDFYGNKGTESAYKFLFRVLYDSDVEFYYPKEDILKTSDGRWIEKLSIKTTSSNGSVLFSAKGTSVYQYIGNALVASADIDTVVQYNQDGYEITEFFLKNLVGNFVNSNPVSFSIGGQQYTETLYSVLSEFFIQTPGSNFRVGDKVFITDTKGTGFSAFIEQTGLGGTIKKIGVKNSGINYFNTVTVSFISDTGTLNSAVVIAKPTAVTRYPGFYTNNSGKLSSTKKIQDGNYYQDFSYVLKTSVSLDTYFSILKDLVHPAGTKMFGSILVKDAIDNTTTTSTQGVVFRDPIIGNYTPYTSGTTLDLRNNGRTGGAGWCGAEGDLYPLGYNPYIGSTSEVGPSGKTAPLGTLFYGTSLGYTYCIVPEGGRTAHDPLGAPLGSTTAWFRGKETALTPEGMRGLVLWLKPENIGVCGAVVDGASVDVWRDASSSQNHAVPPTWDKWTAVSYITETVNGSAWNREARSTNPVTKIKFTGTGLCGGFTFGRLFMMGLNQDPSTNTSYSSIDYAWYRNGNYPEYPTGVRRIQIYESQKLVYNLNTSPADSDDAVYEIEYTEPNIVYRLNDTPIRSVYAGYGLTFYIDSSFYNAHSGGVSGITGTSITLLEASFKGNPVVPSWVTSTGITAINYAGVTVDKLRPTLAINDYGIAGATGVSFNGGLIVSPKTLWSQGAATNLVLWSEDFSVPFPNGWQTTGISYASEYGPFEDDDKKTKTAFTIYPASFNLGGYDPGIGIVASLVNGVDVSGGLAYSVYFKPGTYSTPSFRMRDNTNSVNTLTATINVSGSSISSITIQRLGLATASNSRVRVYPVKNGWYRLEMVVDGGGFASNCNNVTVYNVYTGGSAYTLNQTTSIWGAQLNTGTYAKQYVKTSGAVASGSAKSIDYLDGSALLPVVPGGTFESMLTGQHLNLTRPLVLTKDMDAFIVFRNSVESAGRNTGLINSSRLLSDTFFSGSEDYIVSTRGWNTVDRNPATAFSSGYYAVTGNVYRYYPSTSSLLFRPWNSYPTSSVSVQNRGVIGYDPHVSNFHVGRVIGEVSRDTSNILYAYHNGDRATNTSPTTGRGIATWTDNSITELPTPVSGVTIDIGRIGAYVFISVSSSNPFGTTAWVSGVTTNQAASGSFMGILNEVIVFDRKLQEEERQQVYGYLARKYKMDTKLPDSYYLAHASGYEKGLTYWQIAHHPNSKNLLTVPAGISFTGITITNFLNMPETIYKSKGTVLSGGTVLTGDTYGYLENTGA